MAMILLSVLPIGLIQTWASVEHGYAYARSPELTQTPVMTVLRWLRVPGDLLFSVGIVAIVAFILGVGRKGSTHKASKLSTLPPRAEPAVTPAQ